MFLITIAMILGNNFFASSSRPTPTNHLGEPTKYSSHTREYEEGKSIAEHTGSSQKVDEAKKQAVGRGKVSTKVPPQENEPETKSEIESDQEGANEVRLERK